ncbi:imelysin family protein [Halomonas sp. PA16-9]|uniref:imelysin family protein n=1 Tax=Halomonas sp. PA16-9 TaxID=2576841 RepID=UPI0030EED34A
MPAIMLRRPLAGIVALSALMPFAPVAVDTAAAAADGTVSADAVVKHYADLAHANYADALNAAQALNERIDELLANPTAETLSAAKQAWLQARVPYQQSEVFRFGNAVVDDWEGQLNAWPLDEGMIDYVEAMTTNMSWATKVPLPISLPTSKLLSAAKLWTLAILPQNYSPT